MSAFAPDFNNRNVVDAREPNREAHFRDLAESAPVLLWVSGADHACEYCNKRSLDFTGLTMDAARGDGWIEGLHPEDRRAALVAYRRAMNARREFEIEYRYRRHDGQYRWLSSAGVPRFDLEGHFLGYVGSCVDMTDHKQAQIDLQGLLNASDQAHAQLAEQTRRLHQLAESDPLTGMLNRRSFRSELQREWSRADRYDRPIACIMLDLDFFKKVNDTHGHGTGDVVLKRVANLLIAHCRPSDRVCRYGGEEFCIMAPETDEIGGAALAERLRAALANTPIEIDGKSLRITGSFGAAERIGEGDEVDQLIDRADQALYVAKHSGRNRVVRFAAESTLAGATNPNNPLRILSQLTAGNLATPTVSIDCAETIGRAIEILLEHRVGSAPVTDSSGTLVGFISELDLMALDITPEVWSRSVRDVMKTNFVAYDEHVLGHLVFQFLCRSAVRQVVIVRDGRPTGVINPGGLLRLFQQRVAAHPIDGLSAR
jgi:diguanylate cyclase (GGDEF)-like protein/PAS domain S-box-containing protein